MFSMRPFLEYDEERVRDPTSKPYTSRSRSVRGLCRHLEMAARYAEVRGRRELSDSIRALTTPSETAESWPARPSARPCPRGFARETRTVPPKPSLRVMFGALVEAREDSLTITADNFEILCRVEVPATVEREGSAVLSAQRLLKLLENADGDEVDDSRQGSEIARGDLWRSLFNPGLRTGVRFSAAPHEPVAATFEIPNLRAALAWLSPVVNDDSQNQGFTLSALARNSGLKRSMAGKYIKSRSKVRPS